MHIDMLDNDLDRSMIIAERCEVIFECTLTHVEQWQLKSTCKECEDSFCMRV